MPKLTYLIAVELSEDDWDRAAQLVKAKPLQGIFEKALADAEIVGTVKASFDGRSAPRVKTETPNAHAGASAAAVLAPTPPPNGRAAATVATEAG